MMNPTIGNLDRRVTIQQRSVTRETTFGSEVVTWSDLATVWAKVMESSTAPPSNPGQNERVAAYERPMKIVIRWRSDVGTEMRLNYEGRLLQITGTAELGRHTWLEMSCQEWAHE